MRSVRELCEHLANLDANIYDDNRIHAWYANIYICRYVRVLPSLSEVNVCWTCFLLCVFFTAVEKSR